MAPDLCPAFYSVHMSVILIAVNRTGLANWRGFINDCYVAKLGFVVVVHLPCVMGVKLVMHRAAFAFTNNCRSDRT